MYPISLDICSKLFNVNPIKQVSISRTGNLFLQNRLQNHCYTFPFPFAFFFISEVRVNAIYGHVADYYVVNLLQQRRFQQNQDFTRAVSTLIRLNKLKIHLYLFVVGTKGLLL